MGPEYDGPELLRGQTVYIYFYTHAPAGGASGRAWQYIDDVRVMNA